MDHKGHWRKCKSKQKIKGKERVGKRKDKKDCTEVNGSEDYENVQTNGPDAAGLGQAPQLAGQRVRTNVPTGALGSIAFKSKSQPRTIA